MAKSSTTFQPGHTLKGGRPKGIPNRKTVEFLQILEANNFNPGQALIDIYQKQMAIYELRNKSKNKGGALEALADAEKTVNDICQYVYPRKKAIEHSGDVTIRTFADFMAAAKPVLDASNQS
jgi:hypothetical protein